MKTLFKTVTILAILASGTISCDDVKELADIKIDTVLTEYFEVNLEGGSDSEISNSMDISILTSEIKPYAEKLKDVNVEKVTFEIINYNGDAEAEFDVQFKADGTLFLEEIFVVSEAAANSTMFEVSNTNELNSLATKLLNNESVEIYFSAKSTNLDEPIYFKVEAKFYIEVVANPL